MHRHWLSALASQGVRIILIERISAEFGMAVSIFTAHIRAHPPDRHHPRIPLCRSVTEIAVRIVPIGPAAFPPRLHSNFCTVKL
jgi:hypothetical protein